MVFLCAGQGLLAEQIPELLSRFDSAVMTGPRYLFGRRGDSPGRHFLPQLRQEIDTGHWTEAIETVHRIRFANQGDEVVRAGAQLIEQLQAKAASAEDVHLRTIDGVVDRAGQACLRAEGPRELDRDIAELRSMAGRWRNDGRSESEPMFRARAKLTAAIGYLQLWQEYLALRATGKEVEAAKRMEDLGRKTEWYPVVPRSEVLARSVPPPLTPPPLDGSGVEETLKAVFGKMKSLDDLDATADELALLAEKQSGSPKIRATAESNKRLQGARRALAAQDFAAAFGLCIENPGNYLDVAEHLTPFRRQLLLQVLPHYLPPRNLSEPPPDEKVPEYLMRTAKAAIAAQDWTLALRSFEALGIVSFNARFVPSWLNADVVALSSLIRGDKENSAGEFIRAAGSYQTALEAASENAPVQAIAERLRALKKQHPEVFKQAKPEPRQASWNER